MAILIVIFLVAVLSAIGYYYRDYLLFYGEKVFALSPGEAELPQNGADELEPEDFLPDPVKSNPPDGEPMNEEPTDRELEGDKPSPYPPPPGELLHIDDGDYLLSLVTKQTTLGDYAPQDLVKIPREVIHPDQRQWDYFLRQEACKQLSLMCDVARAEGIELLIISAYRSYDTQKRLFRDYADRHGEKQANTFSARAGQSEHQLGTAVDFGGTGVDKNQAFADTKPGCWLAENAYRFGFAMSYPLDSQSITGYIYEPWHFRYIGEENALAWKESAQVLSVFLENKEQYWGEQ